jgi:nucleolar GTP-binding protein
MAFSEIPKIETYDTYINTAFKRAQKVQENDTRKKQQAKLRIIKEYLTDALLKIVKKFPDLNNLDEFYMELIKSLLEYSDIKKSLGAMMWALKKINFFYGEYDRKIRHTRDHEEMLRNEFRMQFYGRVKSVMKQIKTALQILEEARKAMSGFPSIKTSMKTGCIAGFPNAGKTTLLYKLTGSMPDIKPYAFTTQGLNVAYYKEIQLIDTPGTLNRPNKTNKIEFIAYTAMKHLAEFFIYVFDPTEEYPIEDQIELYKKIKKYGRKILAYTSKTDISTNNKELLEKFKPRTIEELKKELEKISIEDENKQQQTTEF